MANCDSKHLDQCNSSKEARDSLERRYDNCPFSIDEDKSVGEKVGVSSCLILMASHLKLLHQRPFIGLVVLVSMNSLFKICMICWFIRRTYLVSKE